MSVTERRMMPTRGAAGSLRRVGALAVLAIGLAAASASDGVPVAAQVVTATPTPTAYLFQDNDPFLVYEGDWTRIEDSKSNGGTRHQTRQKGAIARIQFTGPYVKWYGVRGPNRGRARLTVDGVVVGATGDGIIDLYRPNETTYELISWVGGLNSDTPHTLVIEVLGQRNGASSDSIVDLDALEVTSADRPPVTATPSPTPQVSPTPTLMPGQVPGTQSVAGPVLTNLGSTGGQGLVSGTPTVDRAPGSWPIDSRFLRYYVERDGPRILGNTISPPTFFAGYFAQYFEKGRLEDQTGITPDPNWQFQYGLLVDELQTLRLPLPIGGEVSTLTYATINDMANEARRIPAPTGFKGGTQANSDGSVFVPYSQALQPGPGHYVHQVFWPYINRADLFPGGWLHDIGLPMTEAVSAVVSKGPFQGRSIMVQVFQRTILTYDPMNGAEFQVERANVGTDYRRAFPDRVPQ
ncbi:MAG: hypothetical protein ACKO2D_10190 [Chloroflexota bacterium]|nr:hypothetical protein [Chloroflexota bacterium]NCA13004.1 hypothetical protein [Pseudomonadota bacterium]